VSQKYAHGVELDTPEARRREVKKGFSDSPVRLIDLASSARFNATEPGKLGAAVESAKAHAKLSYDVGASGIRVFANDFLISGHFRYAHAGMWARDPTRSWPSHIIDRSVKRKGRFRSLG